MAIAGATRRAHAFGMRGLLIGAVLASTASADPKKPASAPTPVWIGTFVPKDKKLCSDGCDALRSGLHAGVVRVLTPSDGSVAAFGDVWVVHPLLKAVTPGKVGNGTVALASFAYDENRETDAGVFVLPATAKPVVVSASAADVAAIKETLLVHAEELAKIRRAVASLEVGAVDLDGDGKPDLVATFGCNAWADGICQGRGQFFLARRGGRWVVID
jgi:hypothetical protein